VLLIYTLSFARCFLLLVVAPNDYDASHSDAARFEPGNGHCETAAQFRRPGRQFGKGNVHLVRPALVFGPGFCQI
jgi:hypothetical protein